MNIAGHRNEWLSFGLIWGSILLLFAFLVYWNIDTYNRKKVDLVRELEYQAKLASSEVNDSLFYSIVRIVNLDTNATEVTRSIRTMTKGIKIRFDGEPKMTRPNTDSMVIAILDDQFALNTIPDTLDSYWQQDIDTSSNDAHAFAFHFEDTTMSQLVLSGFEKKLSENNLPVAFDVVEEGEFISNKNAIAIDFQFDKLSKVKSAAIFTNYQTYLFKKIVPSFLSSLFLFVIVCGAFYLVHRSWREQQHLNEIKNEFVSNMTHELKTPITTVGVALEALKDFNALSNPAKTLEYIEISKHELNRLNMLVDKVLKMSMFENGKSILKLEEVNLKSILEEILSSMKLHFERKNVDIDYSFSGTNFDMEGDKVHLTNVCYNLIDNAIKYSGDHPKIRIALGNHPDKITMAVTDNGMGIPKAYLGKVFQRFFRVPTNDQHDVKGHGLGLNYVQQIVEKHHGHIKVESEEGAGTTFYIELPKRIKDA